MSGEYKWDPYSNHFAAAESATKSHLTEHPLQQVPGQHSLFETGGIDRLIGSLPLEATTAGDRFIGATSSPTHRSTVDAAQLARHWGKSLSTSETTLKTTTPQNQLRKTLLRTAVYSDTLFSDTKSIRGHTICDGRRPRRWQCYVDEG